MHGSESAGGRNQSIAEAGTGWSRRGFVGALVGAALTVEGAPEASIGRGGTTGAATKLPLACNQYPWVTQYRREGRSWERDLDASLADVAAAGAESLEPILESLEMTQDLAERLPKHGLKMHSVYVNSALHEPHQIETSIESVLRMAGAAQTLAGTRIVVTNPSPIRWHGPENKDDDQILRQGEALDRLGAALRREGLILAYHSHDAEMRMAAREFHHMLASTDPDNVKLCLDAHWVFRGSGDSSVAVFDIIELYGDRIVELHARQSRAGIWTETFAEGDIDYVRLAATFVAKGIRPLVTVEQEVEDATPRSMGSREAQRLSHEYARRVFAELLL